MHISSIDVAIQNQLATGVVTRKSICMLKSFNFINVDKPHFHNSKTSLHTWAIHKSQHVNIFNQAEKVTN